MEIIIVDTENQVIEKLSEEISECAKQAIESNGVFRIGLSGGSLVKYLCNGIPNIKTDWSCWRLFFCDERFVEILDNDSTFGTYKRNLIPKTKLKEEQFIQINTEISLEKCAQDYQSKILKEFQVDDNRIPQFDLLLLGMGPDGHTCSLFPGHILTKETNSLIAPIDDSPKPPPKRVTMTFPLINNAKCCIFAMSGAGKAEMVKRVFVDKEPLPAGMVSPINGKLKCIFDKEAGIHLL